jgi:hypothetical protein
MIYRMKRISEKATSDIEISDKKKEMILYITRFSFKKRWGEMSSSERKSRHEQEAWKVALKSLVLGQSGETKGLKSIKSFQVQVLGLANQAKWKGWENQIAKRPRLHNKGNTWNVFLGMTRDDYHAI